MTMTRLMLLLNVAALLMIFSSLELWKLCRGPIDPCTSIVFIVMAIATRTRAVCLNNWNLLILFHDAKPVHEEFFEA